MGCMSLPPEGNAGFHRKETEESAKSAKDLKKAFPKRRILGMLWSKLPVKKLKQSSPVCNVQLLLPAKAKPQQSFCYSKYIAILLFYVITHTESSYCHDHHLYILIKYSYILLHSLLLLLSYCYKSSQGELLSTQSGCGISILGDFPNLIEQGPE